MAVFAVIGANYGDEGKGLITDYVVSQNPNSIVVRFNGGGQAGHSVEHTDCTGNVHRHAFGHFGSGSFLGAPTFLSRFFVVNPLLFMKEYNQLIHKLYILPKVFIDPLCPVTLPCDILINQDIEEKRGGERHGSCGVGFGETIERHMHPEYRITFGDLLLDDSYKRIVDRSLLWHKERCIQLGLPDPVKKVEKYHQQFFDTVSNMKQKVLRGNLFDLKQYDNIVFEGAQGLLLDMDNKDNFPYVTRSNTGLKNVVTLCENLGIMAEEIQAIYVSRCYLTRHGEDPNFKDNASHVREFFNVKDETNVFNDWQKELKLGILNIPELVNRISTDVKKYNVSNSSIAVTCLDQAINSERFIYEENLDCITPLCTTLSKEDFIFEINNQSKCILKSFANGVVQFVSNGPRRSDVFCKKSPLF